MNQRYVTKPGASLLPFPLFSVLFAKHDTRIELCKNYIFGGPYYAHRSNNAYIWECMQCWLRRSEKAALIKLTPPLLLFCFVLFYEVFSYPLEMRPILTKGIEVAPLSTFLQFWPRDIVENPLLLKSSYWMLMFAC